MEEIAHGIIGEIALSSPIALIGMTQWSLAKLRQYLIEQKIIAHISIRWLGEILRRYGVRCGGTKTWKESTDPLFVKKFRAIRNLYRHRPVNGRRLCIDEFGPLHLLPRHPRQSRDAELRLLPRKGQDRCSVDRDDFGHASSFPYAPLIWPALLFGFGSPKSAIYRFNCRLAVVRPLRRLLLAKFTRQRLPQWQSSLIPFSPPRPFQQLLAPLRQHSPNFTPFSLAPGNDHAIVAGRLVSHPGNHGGFMRSTGILFVLATVPLPTGVA